MSLSKVGPPGSVRPGIRGPYAPDRERWNAIRLPSGLQVAELPRVTGVGFRSDSEEPSVLMRKRSEAVLLTGAPSAIAVRLLSKMIFPLPPLDRTGAESPKLSFVSQTTSEPSGFMMLRSALPRGFALAGSTFEKAIFSCGAHSDRASKPSEAVVSVSTAARNGPAGFALT